MRKIKDGYNTIAQFILLILLDTSLRLFGFHRLFNKFVSKYKKYSIENPPFTEFQMNEMMKDLMLIDRVCAHYPFEAKCLHRSFLGYRLLCTKYKINVELVIGVRKVPFYAHAWLKCDGLNMNEQEDVTDGLIIILSSHEMRYKVESILR